MIEFPSAPPTQREYEALFYQWERHLVYKEGGIKRLSKPDAESFVEYMSSQTGIPMGLSIDPKANRLIGRATVSVKKSDLSKEVILHEVTHVLVGEMHMRAFVLVYVELLSYYAKRRGLKLAARQWGLL